MERKVITIGRDTDNTIQINQSDISGRHVRITRTDRNTFFVEDLGSTNHTFVDDMPVRKATIGLEDKLRLSKDTFIDLKEIFQIEPDDKPAAGDSIYIDEFLKLKTLWDETERQKKQVRMRYQRNTSFIRLGIMLVFIVAAIPFQAKLGPVFFVISVAAGAIASAFVPVSTPEELRTLEERLHRTYVCPHCESKLGQWSWSFYAETDKCSNPNCKKSFKKNK